MGNFNRKVLVKHPLTFKVLVKHPCNSHVLKISPIEQKSSCNDKFTRFWEIENSNRKENFSMSEFIQKVEFSRQKYETPDHWKTDHELLPDYFLLDKID